MNNRLSSLRLLSLSVALSASFAGLASSAHASNDKYCRAGAPAFDIHVFGYTFKNEEAKKQMAQGLGDLYKKFEIGSRVKVYAHSPAGHHTALNQCVPGCPTVGFFEGLVNTTCMAEVGKRDRAAFNKRFADATMSGLNRNNSSYDIFTAIQNLSDVYKGQRHSGTVVAAISMLPDGVNPADPASFNAYYVQQVPKLRLALEFPPVYTIGASTSGEVFKFWKEVFEMKKVSFQMRPLD
jgi:hypothetical protein